MDDVKKILIKKTVMTGGEKFYLVGFNFSLDTDVFREMINRIKDAVGSRAGFFWDEVLKVWVINEKFYPTVEQIVDGYFQQWLEQGQDLQNLKEQIRQEANKPKDV